MVKKSGQVRTDDGLVLNWEKHGEGPALVCCNGVGVSTFFWKYIVQEFETDHTVVLWDYRGHGKSERVTDVDGVDLTVARSAKDLVSVLDAAEVESAVALGHSMGCQVALEAALDHSRRIDGLVLMQGSAGQVLETFFDNPRSKTIHRLLLAGAKMFRPIVNRVNRRAIRHPIVFDATFRFGLVDPFYTEREDFRPYLEHMAEMEPYFFLKMVEEAHHHNAFPRLGEIDQPVLVVAAEKDTFTPMWLSKRIAREIPKADLLVLADATHAAIIEQPAVINARVRRFLQGA